MPNVRHFGAHLALLLAVCGGARGVRAQLSDDFSAAAINDTLWTIVDPIGDSTLSQANGLLTIAVPAGTEHDMWTSGNQAPRLVQPVADMDIALEVKFESLPTLPYQIQGLLLEQSPGNYIRIDFDSDGTDLQLFVASFEADTPTVRGIVTIPATGPLWLRVDRVADSFTVSWSGDGSTWQNASGFTHTMNLTRVGVYAGNAGGPGVPVPAHTALVDYFFDQAAPIDPEDHGLVDIWPPAVSAVEVVADPATRTALVTCNASEPAIAVLSLGLDPAYGTEVLGTSVDGLSHSFELTGLTTDAIYHFAITATDTLGNAGTTADQQFLNVEVKPIITVWGGLAQRVGHLGTAQADFNLAGNVFRWETLASLGYSINGGSELPLSWGDRADGFGDARRLAANGDFNADVPLVQLQMGTNSIALRAVDIYGKQDLQTVVVTREVGASPLPLDIAWSTVADVQDVGQAVDGVWAADSTGLRTLSTGYDRIFLLGEVNWRDYEITCPVTVHAVQAPGPLSDKAGLGFLMRFTGHVVGGHRNWPDAQPKWGYQPFGGIGWLRWIAGATSPPTVQFYHGDYDVLDNFGTIDNSLAGATIWLKMRCESLEDAPNGDGVTRYSLKVWPAGETEPVAWNFQVVQQSPFALRQGAVGLLAHHVEATFGDVTIVDLGGGVSAAPGPLPNRFALDANVPNPFNPSTRIAFTLPAAGAVDLAVFDVGGRLVATLLAEDLPAGSHEVSWDGTDASGRPVASGPYLYRLKAGGQAAAGKMLLLK